MNDDFESPITAAISELIRGMCFYPDALSVREEIVVNEKHAVQIIVRPHQGDYAVIVGKAGRQALALERLCRRAGELNGIQCRLVIQESERGEKKIVDRIDANRFDVTKCKRLLARFNQLVFLSPAGFNFKRSNGCFRAIIEPPVEDEGAQAMIHALDDAFWPYGKRAGTEIKIRLAQP